MNTLMPIVTASTVAPLVGAWIEIGNGAHDSRNYFVAPLVGAWIEILEELTQRVDILVAPLVGAWIEIKETFYL